MRKSTCNIDNWLVLKFFLWNLCWRGYISR